MVPIAQINVEGFFLVSNGALSTSSGNTEFVFPFSDGFMTRLIGRHLQAINISIADPLMFEGDVLQQPTTPVMKETNMKKKAVIKSAIIARPMSEK